MRNRLFDSLNQIIQQESFSERRERMLPSAGYGALLAIAYTVAFSLINVISFPGLPLGLDWLRMLGMLVGFGVIFALSGAIAAWFTEEYAGIVGGGILITILLSVVFLFSSDGQGDASVLQSLISAVPLVGVSMLGAWGLRVAAHRHLAITQKEKPELRRKRLTRHILTILLIGLVSGIFGRMDLPAERTLTQLHELLQAAPDDPSIWPRLPLKKVPALEEHFGVDYVLYPRQSIFSAGALDVTIRFEDGFVMTCFLPISSGSNFITQCSEGDSVVR